MNSIAKFTQYTTLLDEVYRRASATSMLDISGTMVQAGANANQIIIPKYEIDGLGDYKRNGGYVGGSVKVTHELVEFNYDRGRKFEVDAMDNVESAGIAFGSLSSQFIRNKAVPEADAFRFATYASEEGILKNLNETFSTGVDVLASLTGATNAMDEEEVDAENRILFITPTLNTLIGSVDTNKSKEIMNRFSQVVTVPQKRFYTAIDLLDGESDNELVGGYKKNEAAQNINYMIIEKSAVIQYTKHTVTKVFSPEENQNSDGWIFVYRSYGLATTYENRRSGIYLSAAPKA